MVSESVVIEKLASKFHDIYQEEARRQGDVRHKDSYDELSDDVKEFDRVLAIYVYEHFVSKLKIKYALEKFLELYNHYYKSVSCISKEKLKEFMRSILGESLKGKICVDCGEPTKRRRNAKRCKLCAEKRKTEYRQDYYKK